MLLLANGTLTFGDAFVTSISGVLLLSLLLSLLLLHTLLVTIPSNLLQLRGLYL